jgi:preprotein translocase subunit SecF
MNLIKYRKWWYLLSTVIIVPGIISLFMWGFKPSIDFTGGSKFEIGGVTDGAKVETFAKNNKLENYAIQKVGSDAYSIRFKEVNDKKQKEIKDSAKKAFGDKLQVLSFETVGPTISAEITRNAFIAVALASLIIIVYIGYSFRRVPYPASSWEFGVAAVIAVLHDVIVLLGVFSILGHFYNIEVDPLFITAILTVIGFSVHDTIVIFDRIRENLIKKSADSFDEVVNLSIVEMLPRTINTTFLVWVILLILLVFGGSSIRYFVLALVIGIFSGTYSSILNASPLLVTWENYKLRRRSKQNPA